ncbi:MAG: hypothetical protein ABIF85_02350 [Nanoarchaeota archaeon]|nr:hypothetical protein [Nanoarchaeota archaeon]MBU4300387.1 hypothetical protein [Nanoarchaeota archaeon]MBU4451339.1 hypothetical protein [Nanoarchaeota archaeon]MCG2723742.1 hypothetical protein [archaeon]
MGAQKTVDSITKFLNDVFYSTAIKPTTKSPDYDDNHLGLSTATFNMNNVFGISKIVAFYCSQEGKTPVPSVYVCHIITTDVSEIKEKYPEIFSAPSVAAYLEDGVDKKSIGNKVFFDKQVPERVTCNTFNLEDVDNQFNLKNFDNALSGVLELMDAIKDKHIKKLTEDE